MRPILPNSPKVMIDVNGRPFLSYLIELLKDNDVKDIVIAVGFLADNIRDYFGNGKNFGVKIEYSETHMPQGTGGEIKLASPYLRDTFFVVNGDTYLPEDYKKIFDVHKQKKAPVTMMITRQPEGKQGGLISLYPNGFVRSITSGVTKGKSDWINAGLYLLEKKFVKNIPSDKRVSLENDILAKFFRDRTVFAYKSQRSFLEVGTPETYQEVVKYLKRV